jgi:hypothetical protein
MLLRHDSAMALARQLRQYAHAERHSFRAGSAWQAELRDDVRSFERRAG